MIDLKTMLSVFLMPTCISILLVIGGLALHRRMLCWVGIGMLWLASTTLVGDATMRAAEAGQERRPLSTVAAEHAIVVLSGGRVQPPGDPDASEWIDADRFYGGIELYKAGKAPLLIFTGGWSPRQRGAKPEGDVLMVYATELGVPRDRILATGRVVNTDAEAHAVAALLAGRVAGGATPRVLLVTSAFHMRRARMLFARAGVETVPFPVDFRVSEGKVFTLVDVLPNAVSLKQTETALHELYGMLFYWVRSRFS
jgi:uncharacterized SAM-binding protein YcdF (DUF218 family)